MSQQAVTKSILVADDDPGFLLWAASILAQAGYSLKPAKSVTEALKWIDDPDAEYHLLLINPNFPAAHYLVQRARERHPGLKVVSLIETSWVASIGADAVITKPADVDSPDTVSAWVKQIDHLISKH